MMKQVPVLAVVFAAVALAVSGCSGPGSLSVPSAPAPSATALDSSAPSASAPAGNAPSSAATTEPPQWLKPATQPTMVAQNLQSPWSIAFVGNTPLISERDSGTIVELASDGSTHQVGQVAGVISTPGGEQGLLGLAVDTQQRLYAYSTSSSGNRIQRFDLRGKPGDYSLGPPATLLEGLKTAKFHNGGRLAFGPDGMLYAAVGDATGGAIAQDKSALNGKILRMTPDGKAPAENPFPGSLVYSYGHRNPQGLAWGSDGKMYASEFGQDTWDELNVIIPGANYGWPVVEGIASDPRFTDPVQQWHPDEASPSGITVTQAKIYLAALRGERLITVPLSDLGSSSVSQTNHGRLRLTVTTPGGALWIMTNNTDGRGSGRPGDDQIISIPAP